MLDLIDMEDKTNRCPTRSWSIGWERKAFRQGRTVAKYRKMLKHPVIAASEGRVALWPPASTTSNGQSRQRAGRAEAFRDG